MDARKGIEFPVCELPLQPYVTFEIDKQIAELREFNPDNNIVDLTDELASDMKPFIEALLVEKRKAGLKGGGFKVAIWSTGAK